MYSKKSTLKKMSKKPVKRSKSRLNVKRSKVNSKRVTTKRKTKKSNKKSRKSQKKQLGGESPHGHGRRNSAPSFFNCEKIIKNCKVENTCNKEQIKEQIKECEHQGWGGKFGR